MAIPAAPPRDQSPGTAPVLIVAGTLLAVIVATFAIFKVGGYQGQEAVASGPGASLAGPAPVGACGQGTPADPSYTVDLVANPEPPRPEGTTFLLTLRHDGKPVTGAKVCLTADMPEMQHPGINYVAKESSGGRYEARLQFGMGGTWKASATIAEPDKPVVSVPMTIQVAEVGAG
jgi:hypothetical protein